MEAGRFRTSSVRASRDGHEFHEAWTARRALELIYPRDGLCGIAIEGMSSSEEAEFSSSAEEIADLVLYYGVGASFDESNRIEVLQFKYAVAHAEKAVTASDLAETVRKFATIDADYAVNHGDPATRDRVSYGFVTNRTAAESLVKALEALRAGEAGEGHAREAVSSLLKASGLAGEKAREFFARLSLQVGTANLEPLKGAVHRTLASWSPDPSDAIARSRLNDLKDLVRRKAGSAGDGRNVLLVVDILGALGVQSEKDLLPAEARFVQVGKIIPRAELADLAEAVGQAGGPIVVHAEGGVGKTVFFQDAAAHLQQTHETVLFDCFGGGAYRAVEDGRHQPGVGLMHLVNMLASRGLCDPILPGHGGTRELMLAARRRLEKAVMSVREASRKQGVAVFLDAIDNAARQAADRQEEAFPTLLLESLSSDPIEGVCLIASCRSHRLDGAVGKARVRKIGLKAFGDEAIRSFVRERVHDASDAEIAVAKARSQGNARVLSYLVDNWQSLIRDSDVSSAIDVDELIAKRIADGIKDLTDRGSEDEGNAFLAALALLPPPIPVRDLASALGLDEGAIRGFAADLAPLLEATPHGLIFRDEPTETYIHTHYGQDAQVLHDVAGRLRVAQRSSAYAARVLPRLLQILRDIKSAYDLALSDDYPAEIVSDLGKRRLKLARLRAALALAADESDTDRLVGLLMEIGTLEAANWRGDNYIADAPDLVIAANDTESLRRLFEDRTGWPGSRHARLAVAHCLAGDMDEALIHARRLDQWIHWYYTTEHDPRDFDEGPKPDDAAAIAFYLISAGRFDTLVDYVASWRPEFAYALACRAVELAELKDCLSDARVSDALVASVIASGEASVSLLCAVATRRIDLESSQRKKLLGRLAKACRTEERAGDYEPPRHQESLALGLLHAAMSCGALGQFSSVPSILAAASIGRARGYKYASEYAVLDVVPHVLASCLRAWGRGRAVRLADLLPAELAAVSKLRSAASVRELRTIFEAQRVPQVKRRRRRKEQNGLREQEVEGICEVLASALSLVGSVEPWILKRAGAQPPDVTAVVSMWREHRPEGYSRFADVRTRFIEHLGSELAWMTVCALKEPDESAAEGFVQTTWEGRPPAFPVVRWIRYFARVPGYQTLAARLALEASSGISSNEDIENRGREFVELARSILPASRDDAATYFLKGLHELDAIGAGDYDILFELLAYAARQRGGLIAPELAERLMNLCELNFGGEPGKFPWGMFARAAANSIGLQALCKVIRWDDREVASLEYTLPQLVCALMRAGRLTARQATAVFLLVKAASGWDWSIGNGLTDLLQAVEPEFREAVARLVIDRVRNDYSDRGWPDIWSGLGKAIAPYPELGGFGWTEEFSRLEAISGTRQEISNQRSNPPQPPVASMEGQATYEEREEASRMRVREVAASVTVTDSASIDQGLEVIEALDLAPIDRYTLFFSLLRERTSLSQRKRHISALIEGQAGELYWRIGALESCLADWSGTSAFIKAQRAAFARELLARRGRELFDDRYGTARLAGRLAAIGGFGVEDIAVDLVKLASAEGMELTGHGWLHLAALMSGRASGPAARAVLEKVLRSDMAALADETGEGAHRPDMAPPENGTLLTAEVIWHRMGDPDAFARWRAARAVEVLAALRLAPELDALCVPIRHGTHGSLAAEGIRFANLNAKEWLLIGLSHAALKHPAEVAKVSGCLEGIQRDAGAHVLFRTLAARVLVIIEQAKDTPDSARIESLQREALATPRKVPRQRVRDGVGDGETEGEDRFIFEYEFEKYELSGLAYLFGLTEGTVRRAIVRKIREVEPTAESVYDLGHASRRASSDRFESYGAHIVRHAALSAATELARSHPVIDPGYEDAPDFDPWLDWLKRSDLTWADGYWLADATDRRPAFASQFAFGRKDGEDVPPAAPEDIARIAGLVTPMETTVPLTGLWRTEDDVSVRLVSTLVKRRGAIAKCEALARKKPHDLWLPQLSSYDGQPDRHSEAQRRADFPPWIWDREDRLGIDQYDELASGSAWPRLRLGPDVTDEEGLTADDRFERRWVNGSGAVILSSLAWGGRKGSGNEEKDERSSLLLADASWLQAFLERKSLCVAYIVALSKYTSRFEGRGRYVSTSIVALLYPDGHLRFWKVRESREAF